MLYMTKWMLSETATNDVMSIRLGHGVVTDHVTDDAIRVEFDAGRKCELSYSYYNNKGMLFYVRMNPQFVTIEYRDDRNYAYGRKDKYLYHLTDLCNMESIITHGLLSRAQLQNTEAGFVDIADKSIINKRGNLEYFVPFHFVPDTAFDYVVKRDNREKQLVYICISKNYARSRESYILLSHPTSNYAQVPCSFDDGISKLDWDSIESPYAFMNPVSKQNKMAECITAEPVSAENFAVIIVPNEEVAKQIHALYVKHGITCENTRLVVDYNILRA